MEVNLGWQQEKLRAFCKEKGIVITAFSPLRKGASRGSNLVMDNDVLKEIADAHGKTIAQVYYNMMYICSIYQFLSSIIIIIIFLRTIYICFMLVHI